MTGKLFEQKENMLYRVFYVMLLSLGGLYVAVDRELGMTVSVPTIGFIFGVVVLLACINYLQVRGKVISGMVAVGCLILGNRYIEEGQFWSNIYIQLLFLIVGMYLVEILLEKLLLFKVVLGVGILGYLLTCLFLRYTLSHIGAVLFIWILILYLIEIVEHFWKKNKSHPTVNYMMWIMPFCIVYLLLALWTPAPDKPYDWQFVKDIYGKIRENITIWLEDVGRGGKEDFGEVFSGFSEDGRLMSSLVEDDKEILEVQGTIGLKTNVYLMGKVYDTFLGNGWTYQHSDLYRERLLDTMESIYYLNEFDEEYRKDYFAGTKLTVEYLYFDTGFVFAPLKTWLIQDVDFYYDGPNLRFYEQVGYSTKYRASFYQMNINHPSFYAFINSPKEENEERWQQVARDYTPTGEKKVSYEELLQHREKIYDYYLPETKVSQEVREYLDEILEDADTPVEKMIAIEEALQEMEYTLTPGALPEWVQNEGDFLDYFLLESKKGYCSYFATAFVLLARAEGIPARYVEGFSIPVDSDKHVVVYSTMAHAWPEVYLEGVGWIPFEPTPGYAEIRYTPWEPVSGTDQNITGVVPQAEEEEEEIPENEENTDILTENEKEDIDWENVLFVLVTAVGILGCVVLFLWLDRILRKKRYEKMNLTKQFESVAMNNLWLLSKLGAERQPQETLEELRLEKDADYRFIVFLEEVKYGEKEMNELHIQVALEEQNHLLYLLRQKNIWLYFWGKLRV